MWRRNSLRKLILGLFFGLLITNKTFAAEYVLPYPSYMPGNKLYRISRIWDQLNGWWSWGNLASFKYHLRLSDKYLVEAKILFEYKQYLLGVNALNRSNQQFKLLSKNLVAASKEQKDITRLKLTTADAASAHINILSRLTTGLPEEFNWTPEKQQSSKLPLKQLLEQAQELRKQISEDISGL